jgi:hypothetical protein
MSTSTAPKPLPRTTYVHDDAQRPAYAEGLRHLADLIEAGRAPFPNGPLNLWLDEAKDEQPATARELMRALGGGTYAKNADTDTLHLSGMCGGVPVRIWLSRDAVCERVVVGTETVELPAQEALPARTETRERVEWVCSPLLAAADETAAEVTA